MRRGERGQVLPYAAVALLVACLGLYVAARSAITFTDRVRAQTAADATSLAAATAYARGLNIAAESNHVELAAFIVDVIREDPAFTLTHMVMDFQDAFVDTMPAYLDAVGDTIATENGFAATITWNGGGDASLEVHRASGGDLLGMIGGGGGGVRSGPRGRRERFSYQPRGGGPRVEVPPEEVERVTFKTGGKTYTRYRRATPPGEKGGQFVKKEPGKSGSVLTKFLPTPLAESSREHTVLVSGHLAPPAGGAYGTYDDAAVPVESQAEAGQGAVLDATFGDPSFDVRLIPVAGD